MRHWVQTPVPDRGGKRKGRRKRGTDRERGKKGEY
jgi:hypothetical protein